MCPTGLAHVALRIMGNHHLVMRSTIWIHSLLPFRAVNPIPTIEAPAHSSKAENNQQDEEDDEREHDGFPFCTHRAWLLATLHGDSCRVVLCSFTRVNVFLLLVYLERPACASYELMMYADEAKIIRMYEARRGSLNR